MLYAAQQDLVDRFGVDELVQLTDDDDSGAIDTDRVTQVLTDASARIDGYLASRYQLPLTTIPPAIAQYCCDIARYLLAKDTPTDAMTDRYNAAIRYLEKVAAGTFQLGIDNTGATPAENKGGIQVEGGRRIFTDHKLRDYVQPWDWVGDPMGRGRGGPGNPGLP